MRRALVRGAVALGAGCLLLVGCATTPATTEAPKVPKATTGGACSPKEGSKAPDLVIDGKRQIAKGKVTLVDLWATWCGPCGDSFPKYQELYTKYQSQGFEIVAIAMDDDTEKIPSFLETKGVKFPVGWDAGHTVADCWKPANMPTAYIIDKNGVVRHIHREWKTGTSEKLVEKQIKSLL